MTAPRLLLRRDSDGYLAKPVKLFEDPSSMKTLFNPVSWKILNLLAKKPMYPAEIARDLGLNQQRVYYYIHHLQEGGLIKVERTASVRGAVARYYRPTYHAFGVEMPSEEKNLPLSKEIDVESKLERLFNGFVTKGAFDGLIVVGSPEPHGPFKAAARDGHYAVQLGFLLGQLCRLPADFVARLDVDIRMEKKEEENLILIGGPGTNLVTASINRHLPIRFAEENYWRGLVKGSGQVYGGERDGLIAKIRNPLNKEKNIIALAGNRHIGTKSCVIALTRFYEQVLDSYRGQDEWAVVIRGFDMDGDGKVDSVEVVG